MHRQSLVDYGKPLQETETPTPTPLGTEVLLRVSHCGVCHSDVHMQDGYFDLGGGAEARRARQPPMPFTPGPRDRRHGEGGGARSQGVATGKRYAAYPWIGCGECGLCKRGEEQMCNAPARSALTSTAVPTHVLVPHPRYLLDMGASQPGIAACMCSGPHRLRRHQEGRALLARRARC